MQLLILFDYFVFKFRKIMYFLKYFLIFLNFENFLDPRSSEPAKVEPRTSEVPLYSPGLCPIFKKGSLEDATNYHPVILTSALCKIFEKLLKMSSFCFFLLTKHEFTITFFPIDRTTSKSTAFFLMRLLV